MALEKSSARFRRLRLGALAGVVVIVVIVAGILMSASARSQARFDRPKRSSGFNGKQAYEYLVRICKLGPRMSGSPAMQKQQRMLEEHFESLGAKVELQRFQATQPSLRGRKFECVNLIVHWHPDAKRRVLLGAHYDTRPIADQEPLVRNRRKPILGANDGASGVALLMELGRLMPKLETNVGVDFVFFDAEEYIHDPDADEFFIGSEYFAQDLARHRRPYRYEAAVVVDMVADRHLEIYPDQRSAARAGPLVQEVWNVATDLGVRQFRSRVGYDILDDHIALQDIGIPAIVLIDFDYPYWHRLSDTPQRCSGQSLEVVGAVVAEWLKRRK